MEDVPEVEIKQLAPVAIFGFNGKVKCGIKVHPQQHHILFPLGNKISIVGIRNHKQEFLVGHEDIVTALDVSKSGSLVASAQQNRTGARARIILWAWETRSELARYDIHKLFVQSLCFSANERFVISLGGPDCGNLVVWDVEKKVAICGAIASRETTGNAEIIHPFTDHGSLFVSAGDQTLRVWEVDFENRKMKPHDAMLGKLRRQFSCVQIDAKDEFMYVGTISGDLVKVKLNCHPLQDEMEEGKVPVLNGCFGVFDKRKPPGKDCQSFKNGIRQILLLPSNGRIVIGTGEGLVQIVEEREINYKSYSGPTYPKLTGLKKIQLGSAITSLQLVDKSGVVIGTEASEIYYLDLATFQIKLLKTCHTDSVSAIAFPENFPLVFATASYESIRLWSAIKFEELLRIVVKNFTATGVIFAKDGKSIISSWNDGCLRAFTPLTGKLIFTISNAHNKGCTCVAISNSGKLLASGGVEGQVRVWKILANSQDLVGVLKQHSASVATVDFNKFGNEILSASSDGTCIVWDVITLTRKLIITAQTQFTCARYFPTGVQILTAGTDRQISYWEAHDASLIREVEGAFKGAINDLSISSAGDNFVSVGNDHSVKLWDYQQGVLLAIGRGHAAHTTTCCYSPCGKLIISGGADGSIFIWKIPAELIGKKEIDGRDTPKSTVTSSSSRSSRTSNLTKAKYSYKPEENVCNLSIRKKNGR